MRIHTDTVTVANIYDAARTARVTLDRFVVCGSKSRDHAFDITLQGESRRNQNGGDGKAATWDQWGVFLAILFSLDENLTIPRAYADGEQFAFRTADRFGAPDVVMTATGYQDKFTSYGEPFDAHGDHTFRYSGMPRQQECTKCSATQRW